jgi:hypothetical protein
VISPETKLSTYWQKQKVVCHKAAIDGALFGTDLAEAWELIGMPAQEWWPFRFAVPVAPIDDGAVKFGSVGTDWELLYTLTENTCLVKTPDDHKRFANSSFVAFMQLLTLFDEGHRRIQKECPGDSGEDWDRGDIIIQEMETAMRLVDARAFECESNLWPYLLTEING